MVDWQGRTAAWAASQRPELIEQLLRLAHGAARTRAAAARAAVGRAADSQASRNAAATVVRQQAEARAALGAARTL